MPRVVAVSLSSQRSYGGDGTNQTPDRIEEVGPLRDQVVSAGICLPVVGSVLGTCIGKDRIKAGFLHRAPKDRVLVDCAERQDVAKSVLNVLASKTEAGVMSPHATHLKL